MSKQETGETVHAMTVEMVSDMASMLGGWLPDVCDALQGSITAFMGYDIHAELDAIKRFCLQHGSITFKYAGDDRYYMTPANKSGQPH